MEIDMEQFLEEIQHDSLSLKSDAFIVEIFGMDIVSEK
jgi:hypothetical protein